MTADGDQGKEVETFESVYTALEEAAKRLEEGNMGLDESVALYEEGARLVEQLREILTVAEARVQAVRSRLENPTQQ
ncbi:MAG TPA: exodeoxyribonuclease VII small subunit [Dehalococcoidia bacterium]|nr:exodeoxyribonuclease VII small subunit [Dehalococcoidia bacterium]